MNEKKSTYIDLFAGCGGLSLGLHNSGKWKGLFAIEKSEDAFKTLKHNLIDKKKHFDWPTNWLGKPQNLDINNVIDNYSDNLTSLRGKVDLVAGGPPCQGFSMAGRRIENDSRNDLINSYIRFIELVEPKIIFFENVRGFTTGFKKNNERGEAYSTYVVKKLEELGYDVEGQLINFSKYGVPQKRTRFILVGIRKNLVENNPGINEYTFFNKLEENKEKFLINKGLELNIFKDLELLCLSCKSSEMLYNNLDFNNIGFGDMPTQIEEIQGARELESTAYHGVENSTIEKYRETLVSIMSNSVYEWLEFEYSIRILKNRIKIRINKAITEIKLSTNDLGLISLLKEMKNDIIFNEVDS